MRHIAWCHPFCPVYSPVGALHGLKMEIGEKNPNPCSADILPFKIISASHLGNPGYTT